MICYKKGRVSPAVFTRTPKMFLIFARFGCEKSLKSCEHKKWSSELIATFRNVLSRLSPNFLYNMPADRDYPTCTRPINSSKFSGLYLVITGNIRSAELVIIRSLLSKFENTLETLETHSPLVFSLP